MFYPAVPKPPVVPARFFGCFRLVSFDLDRREYRAYIARIRVSQFKSQETIAAATAVYSGPTWVQQHGLPPASFGLVGWPSSVT